MEWNGVAVKSLELVKATTKSPRMFYKNQRKLHIQNWLEQMLQKFKSKMSKLYKQIKNINLGMIHKIATRLILMKTYQYLILPPF